MKLVVDKLFTDDEFKIRKGTLIEDSDIRHPIIDKDTDVYWRDGDNEILLCKFRKNVIDNDLISLAWVSYKDLAKASRGRGPAAGPIDPDNAYWTGKTVAETSKWATKYITANGNVSKMRVNNQVASNPIGYFESTKTLGINQPCRLTHFTRTNFEKYNHGIPFINKIDTLFQELIPDSHQKQLDRALAKPRYRIDNTCFSTVTINRNFRTAIHKDAGDFKDGFGNLTVIEEGHYHGGYTVFPQFGIAIDLRTTDFLAMDVHQWHGNTELYETPEDVLKNKDIVSSFKDNPKVGTAGLCKKYTRLSFVCYLREKLIQCEETDIDERYLTKSGHGKIS
jgi:hypothetical protein